MIFFKKISREFVISLSLSFLIACYACKPADNHSSEGLIKSSIRLDADPQPPKSAYDPTKPIKFIATVIPENTQAQQPGGVVKFSYDNEKSECGDGVPLSRLPDGNLQAICPIDLKGGDHEVHAFYAGDKNTGYAPSVNTAKLNYRIIQAQPPLPKLSTEPIDAFTIGDTIKLVVRMDKTQPDMPDFSGEHPGTIGLTITQQSSQFFGLLTSNQKQLDICTSPNDITANNDATGTTFTCIYQITSDFITQPDTTDEQYTGIFSAYYKGNDYYKPSEIVEKKTKISKIQTSLNNLQSNSATYVSGGNPLVLTGFISGSAIIPFLNTGVISLTFPNKTAPTTCSWVQNLVPPSESNPQTSQLPVTFRCQYPFTEFDADTCPTKTEKQCCITIQYTGDSVHTPTSNTKPFCVTLTKGHELNIVVNSIPKSVSVGDSITITGTLEPVHTEDPQADPNFLKFQKILKDGSSEDRTLTCQSVSAVTKQFTCKYQTESQDGDLNKYKGDLYLIYNDNNTFYKFSSAKLDTTITKINSTITLSTDFPNTVEVGNTLTIAGKLSNYNSNLPITEQNFKIYKTINNVNTQICTTAKPQNDGTFSCPYTITTTDFGQNGQNIQFFAQIQNDGNYIDATAQTSKIIQITQISGANLLTISHSATNSIPYKIQISGSRKKQNTIEYDNYTAIIYKSSTPECPNTQDKIVSSAIIDGNGNFQYEYVVNNSDYDPKNPNLYFCARSNSSKYYKDEISNIEQVSLVQTCNPNNNQLSIDYKNCDLYNACKLILTNCPSSESNNFTLKITNIVPLQDAIQLPHPPNPDNKPEKLYNANLTCTKENSEIVCDSFGPITDKFDLYATLTDQTNNNNVYIALKNFNVTNSAQKSTDFAQCGRLGFNNDNKALNNFNYTTVQRMFDCYERTEQYSGIGDGNGGVITPKSPNYNIANSWFLVSCAGPSYRTRCSWLTPEIPPNSRVVDPQYIETTSTVPDILNLSKTDIPNKQIDGIKINQLAGHRVLWSGTLESREQASMRSFFVYNGISLRQRAKDDRNPQGEWLYTTTKGGYDSYSGGSGYNVQDFDVIQQRYTYPGCVPGISGVPTCDGSMDPVSTKTWQDALNYLQSQYDGTTEAKAAYYRFTDVCGRRSKIPDEYDLSLIPISQNPQTTNTYNWHVPSYPLLLMLTGGQNTSDPCGNNHASYLQNKQGLCFKTSRDNESYPNGFRANAKIPNFELAETLFSSSVVLGDSQAVITKTWGFHWGYLMPMLFNNPAQVRCVSIDW